jgi:PAS domain S-box-containing protein
MQLEMYYDPISVWRQMQSARGIHPSAMPVDGTNADGALATEASKVADKGNPKVASQPPQPILSIVPPDGYTAVGTLRPSSKPVITPNTLQQALKPSHEARVITEATRPFRITYVNEAWTQLCGFSPEEACGRTLRMLQGEDTDNSTVNDLVKDCVEQKATSMEVTNYDKQGRKFRNFLQVYPLSDTSNSAGETSHFLGVLSPLSAKCH